MPALNLSSSDLKRIRKTVGNAEKKTSGEIATAIIRESSDYATYEMLFALIGGFIYFFLAVLFRDRVEVLLQSLFWDYSTTHLLLFFGLSTLLVMFLLYLAANIPRIDRLIIPRKVMVREVSHRALRYFAEEGIFHTRNRTGILLFISVLEQRVELIADQGINEKISAGDWEDIISDLVTGIKERRTADAVCTAVSRCGEILSRHYPATPGDTNELDNDLSVVEK